MNICVIRKYSQMKMEFILEPNIKQALGRWTCEILLWIKLVDMEATSVLTDPEDQAKMEMETPRSSGVNSPPNAHT
ncbi:hypothetical protein Tco_0688222 [Tanacetum coccineum]